RLDAIIRPDWNVQDLFAVAIVVANEHRETAVRIPIPPFVGTSDALSGFTLRFSGCLAAGLTGHCEDEACSGNNRSDQNGNDPSITTHTRRLNYRGFRLDAAEPFLFATSFA